MGGAQSQCVRCYPMITLLLPNSIAIRVLHNARLHRVEIVHSSADALLALTRWGESPPESLTVEFSDAQPAGVTEYLKRLCADKESVEIHDNFAGANASYTKTGNLKTGNLMGIDLSHRVDALALIVHTTEKRAARS